MKISTREKYFLFIGAGALVLTLVLLFGDRLIPSRQEGANDIDYKKKLLVKYRETLDGQTMGSSSCQMSCGKLSKNS